MIRENRDLFNPSISITHIERLAIGNPTRDKRKFSFAPRNMRGRVYVYARLRVYKFSVSAANVEISYHNVTCLRLDFIFILSHEKNEKIFTYSVVNSR